MLLLVTKSQPELERHAHPHLGRLVQPRHYSSIERTAASGIPWAADNDCYQGLDVKAFEMMLDRIRGLPGCLFVTCPDVVADHDATVQQFKRWAPGLARRGLPIAFVLQDGCTVAGVPWQDVDALFIGGSTEFKLSAQAERIVQHAKAKPRGFGKPIHIHMGRVNSAKRIRYAEEIDCDSVDGSRWAMFNKTSLDWGLEQTRDAVARERQERIPRMINDADVTVVLGDALEQLALMPSGSVQCIVTSPPFWALRDYGTGRWEGGDPDCDHARRARASTAKRVEGSEASSNHANEGWVGGVCGRCGARLVDRQIGLEETPEAWAARLTDVFREARRVLRDDGTLWLECGDTYASGGASGPQRDTLHGGFGAGKDLGTRGQQGYAAASGAGVARPIPAGVKPKDLVGAPWLLAFALRADGWYLRAEVIWHRPNPMPESVTDRPTKAHSQVFLLSKRARYFYDADAIRDPAANDPKAGGRQRALARGDDRYAESLFNGATPEHEQRSRNLNATKRRTPREGVDVKGGGQGEGSMTFPVDSANARSVWSIPTQPTPFAHFATFPEDLARRCILAGTSERGCCPECGAPWRRITKRGFTPHQETWNHRGSADGQVMAAGLKASGHMPGTPSVHTTGWEPACSHGADEEHVCFEPVPCLVLDPFMGSGTTALVARQLGRRAVGIELNAEYLLIAADRLRQQSLFA